VFGEQPAAPGAVSGAVRRACNAPTARRGAAFTTADSTRRAGSLLPA
jgi:hypothetical protein